MTGPRTKDEATYRAVCAKRGGFSIYALARTLGRPYRRVLDSVRRLAARGQVRVENAIRANRRISLVSSRPLRAKPRLRLPSHLTALERGALEALTPRIAASSPKTERIVLFGSRARGRSDENSDLDLAVIVRGGRDPAFEARAHDAVSDIAWSPPLDGALRISPAFLYTRGSRGPLARAVAEEGIVLWKRTA